MVQKIPRWRARSPMKKKITEENTLPEPDVELGNGGSPGQAIPTGAPHNCGFPAKLHTKR